MAELDDLWQILLAHKDKQFVQRIINPGSYPTLDLGDGKMATHQMEWGEVDTPDGKRYVVYPRVSMQGRKLVDLGDKAWAYAMKNKDFIEFDSPAKAAWFSRKYKMVWGKDPHNPKPMPPGE